MKKVFLKVISGVSVFMFTLGYATHAYLKAKNIELTKPKTAYAMTADADTVINHAREYIGYTNYDITSMGDKYLCDSAWCASFVTLTLGETRVPNSVPDSSPFGSIRPDIRVDEYVKYYMDEGRFHLSQNASSVGFTTANNEYISSEELERCRDGYIPKYGDLIIFEWGNSEGKDGNPDHIGFFISCDNNRLITLEGNPGAAEWYETRVSELDNDYGYYNENYIFGYITPHYSEETTEERIEREAREAKEREEADIQSIADFTANMTGNTFEAMYDILDDNKLTVTFDPGDEGSVEQPTATVYRNACSIYSFPAAIAKEGYTFVSWVDENGVPKDNNSIYDNDTTLYAQYIDSNGNIILNTPIKQIGTITWEKDFTAPIYNKKRVIEDDTTENISESVTTQSDIFLGDVNNDGYINAVDSSIILQYTAQIATSGISLSPEELLRADIDRDGRISSNDSRLALSYYTYLAVLDGSEKMTFDEYLANN